MADESYAATHRTCVNDGCGQTGYVLPVGGTVVSIPPDDGVCAKPGAGGHTWGPYNPSPETEDRRSAGGNYTRLHIR